METIVNKYGPNDNMKTPEKEALVVIGGDMDTRVEHVFDQYIGRYDKMFLEKQKFTGVLKTNDGKDYVNVNFIIVYKSEIYKYGFSEIIEFRGIIKSMKNLLSKKKDK